MHSKEAFDNIEDCKKNIKYAEQEIKTVYPLITNDKEIQQIELNEFNYAFCFSY